MNIFEYNDIWMAQSRPRIRPVWGDNLIAFCAVSDDVIDKLLKNRCINRMLLYPDNPKKSYRRCVTCLPSSSIFLRLFLLDRFISVPEIDFEPTEQNRFVHFLDAKHFLNAHFVFETLLLHDSRLASLICPFGGTRTADTASSVEIKSENIRVCSSILQEYEDDDFCNPMSEWFLYQQGWQYRYTKSDWPLPQYCPTEFFEENDRYIRSELIKVVRSFRSIVAYCERNGLGLVLSSDWVD